MPCEEEEDEVNKAEECWGAGVVEQVSLDLRREFPDADGFSARNLSYMKQWYMFYATPSAKEKFYQLGRDIPEIKLQRPVAEFPLAFALVPWGQHIDIVAKCKTIDEALFYIRETIEKGLSRPALLNCIKGQGLIQKLYNRKNKVREYSKLMSKYLSPVTSHLSPFT